MNAHHDTSELFMEGAEYDGFEAPRDDRRGSFTEHVPEYKPAGDHDSTYHTSLAPSRKRESSIHDFSLLHGNELPISSPSSSCSFTSDQLNETDVGTNFTLPHDPLHPIMNEEEMFLLERCLHALIQLQAQYRGWRLRRQAKKALLSVLLDHQDTDLLDMFKTSVTRDSFESEYYAIQMQRRWRRILLRRRYSRAYQRIRQWVVQIMLKDREGLLWMNRNQVQRIFFIEFYVEEAKYRLEKICNEMMSLVHIQPVSYLRSHIVRDPLGHLQQVYRRCKRQRHINQSEWWKPLLSPANAVQLQRLPHHLSAVPRIEVSALRWRLQLDRDRYWCDSSAVYGLECREPGLLYRITRDFTSAAVDIPFRYDFDVLPETAAVVVQKWYRGIQLRHRIKY